MAKPTVAEVDEHIKFLRAQAERLDNLAEQRSYRWAEVDAKKMRKVAEALLEFRRDMQMTGMNGQRIA
jgi:molybdopterin/thiamine biosynthesis adenylyltransferase